MKVKKSFFLVGTQSFDPGCVSGGTLVGPKRGPTSSSDFLSSEFRAQRLPPGVALGPGCEQLLPPGLPSGWDLEIGPKAASSFSAPRVLPGPQLAAAAAGPVAECSLWLSLGPGRAGRCERDAPAGPSPGLPQPVTVALGLVQSTPSWGGARPPRPGPRPSGLPCAGSFSSSALRRCNRLLSAGSCSPQAPTAGEHGVCGAD